MKVSAKQYAQALLEAAAGKSSAEQTEIVGRFLSLLKAQGRMSMADKIAMELDNLLLADQGIVLAEVQSAHKLTAVTLKNLSQLVKARTACQEVALTEIVDPTILGGAVLKYQDKIIDFSWRDFLIKMKQALIK